MVPLVERLRFLRSVPLFADLSGEELLTVADILAAEERAAGEVVFEKGDPGEDLYLVASGCVSIRDGASELAKLGPREFFGELSVIDREARSATVIATEPTELLRLRGPDLAELVARRPQLQEHMMRVLVRRLRALTARVAQ